MTQTARPNRTLAAGNWQSSAPPDELHAQLDESPSDDGDYVFSPGDPVGEAMEVGIGLLQLPQSGTHGFQVRLKRTGSVPVAATLSLYQVGTRIATRTVLPGTSWGTTTVQLTAQEAALVTNPANLRVRVTAGFTTEGAPFADSFTDAASTALENHEPDVDQEASGWNKVAGDSAQIQGNALEFQGSGFSAYAADAGVSDFRLLILMEIGDAADGTANQCQVRRIDGDNWINVNVDSNLGVVKIERVTGGGFTVLDSQSVTVAPGETYLLVVECDGQTIAATVGGVTATATGVSQGETATGFGVACNYDGAISSRTRYEWLRLEPL